MSRSSHTTVVGFPGETGRDCRSRRAGGFKTSPPGDGLLDPASQRGSSGKGRFQHFGKRCPPEDCLLVSPALRVDLYGLRAFRGWNTIIPHNPLPIVRFRGGARDSRFEPRLLIVTRF